MAGAGTAAKVSFQRLSPAFNRPVDVLVRHSRIFQYKGTEASGQPVYFEALAYTVPEAA
jgi:hypothetical protein